MLAPREFLEQQWQNLEDCLKEALRYEYGPRESGAFFDECSRRLATLKAAIVGLGASPTSKELQQLLGEASRLGALINRIEHAHVGEFSWAFADELRDLARTLCSGPQEPLFFLSSDGPFDSYRIHPEQNEPSLVRNRVFNIVFPKTLKHHALYHPVLGHEVGHAFLYIPARKSIEDAVYSAMFTNSPLQAAGPFRAWLNQFYPAEQANNISDQQLEAIARAWRVEFFCDLFGLIVMGPCFPNALLTILSALDPDGVGIGANHPPPRTRFNLQRIAVDELGWSSAPTGSAAFVNAQKGTWTDFATHTTGAVAGSILSDAQVRAGVQALKAALVQISTSHFQDAALSPLEELFDQILSRIPPIGAQDFSATMPAKRVDFRTIIYSGWLAWKHLPAAGNSDLTFLDINRLCEHAIMQQIAIAAQTKAP